MDHSDGSHNDSTFDTSNLSFDAQFFEDHRSDSSSSLDEQNDPFDDDETERKFVPNNDELGVLGNKTAPTTAAILESTNTTTATTTTTTITPSTSAHNMGEHLTTNGETIFEQIANGATVKTLDTFVVPKENALRKRKSIFELFPWLNEVNRINQQCLGSMIELKNSKLLDVMDFLIGKLTDDYHEYYKAPKLAVILAKFLRTYLYIYRFLYSSFDLGKDYFKRITKLLAIYTDLEVCSSVLGLELDTDTANRIILVMKTHLEYADESVVLDIFINMKRLCRGHRGILSLILQYCLVKLTVHEPRELPDDLFIKHLIVYKKWLSVEEVMDEKQNIRDAFVRQVKPKKTLCMNEMYAPYLPADEVGSATIDSYIRMLDKRYSLEPLIRALNIVQRRISLDETLPREIVQKIGDVVILSDDEDDSTTKSTTSTIVKTEPADDRTPQSGYLKDIIDLTDETCEETDIQRHYIPWLASLVARAKNTPITVDQRLEVATIMADVIVIDDEVDIGAYTESGVTPNSKRCNTTLDMVLHQECGAHGKISIVSSTTSTPTTTSTISTTSTATVAAIDSPSNDSGCVIMTREDVGINSNSNFDVSQYSSDNSLPRTAAIMPCAAGFEDDEDVVSDAIIYENTAANDLNEDGNNDVSVHMNENDTVAGSSCGVLAADKLMTVASNRLTENEHLNSSNNIERSSRVPLANIRVLDSDILSAVSAVSAIGLTPSLSVRASAINVFNKRLTMAENQQESDTTATSDGEEDDTSFLNDVFTTSGPSKHIKTGNVRATALSHDWFSDKNDMFQDQSTLNNINASTLPQRALLLSEHYRSQVLPSDTSDREDEPHDNLPMAGSSKAFKIAARMVKLPDAQTPVRTVRFADDFTSLDSHDDDASHRQNARQRPINKMDALNLEEPVPSTIQERKTYIKSAATNVKSFNQSYSLNKSRPASKAKSPPPPVPTARPPATGSITKNAQEPSRTAAPHPIRVFDAEGSEGGKRFYSPYDPSIKRASRNQPLVPHCPIAMNNPPVVQEKLYRKIDGCYVECDILDEKMLQAVVPIAPCNEQPPSPSNAEQTSAMANTHDSVQNKPRKPKNTLQRLPGLRLDAFGRPVNLSDTETEFESEYERQYQTKARVKRRVHTKSDKNLKSFESETGTDTDTEHELDIRPYRRVTRLAALSALPTESDNESTVSSALLTESEGEPTVLKTPNVRRPRQHKPTKAVVIAEIKPKYRRRKSTKGPRRNLRTLSVEVADTDAYDTGIESEPTIGFIARKRLRKTQTDVEGYSEPEFMQTLRRGRSRSKLPQLEIVSKPEETKTKRRKKAEPKQAFVKYSLTETVHSGQAATSQGDSILSVNDVQLHTMKNVTNNIDSEPEITTGEQSLRELFKQTPENAGSIRGRSLKTYSKSRTRTPQLNLIDTTKDIDHSQTDNVLSTPVPIAESTIASLSTSIETPTNIAANAKLSKAYRFKSESKFNIRLPPINRSKRSKQPSLNKHSPITDTPTAEEIEIAVISTPEDSAVASTSAAQTASNSEETNNSLGVNFNDTSLRLNVNISPKKRGRPRLGTNEPRLEIQKSFSKEPRLKEPRQKEPFMKEPRVKEPRVKEPRLKEPCVKELSLKEPHLKEPRVKELRVKELPLKDLRLKEPRVKEPRVKEPRVKEPRVKEPRVKEPRVKEPRVKEPRVKEPRLKEFSLKETNESPTRSTKRSRQSRNAVPLNEAETSTDKSHEMAVDCSPIPLKRSRRSKPEPLNKCGKFEGIPTSAEPSLNAHPAVIATLTPAPEEKETVVIPMPDNGFGISLILESEAEIDSKNGHEETDKSLAVNFNDSSLRLNLSLPLKKKGRPRLETKEPRVEPKKAAKRVKTIKAPARVQRSRQIKNICPPATDSCAPQSNIEYLMATDIKLRQNSVVVLVRIQEPVKTPVEDPNSDKNRLAAMINSGLPNYRNFSINRCKSEEKTIENVSIPEKALRRFSYFAAWKPNENGNYTKISEIDENQIRTSFKQFTTADKEKGKRGRTRQTNKSIKAKSVNLTKKELDSTDFDIFNDLSKIKSKENSKNKFIPQSNEVFPVIDSNDSSDIPKSLRMLRNAKYRTASSASSSMSSNRTEINNENKTNALIHNSIEVLHSIDITSPMATSEDGVSDTILELEQTDSTLIEETLNGISSAPDDSIRTENADVSLSLVTPSITDTYISSPMLTSTITSLVRSPIDDIILRPVQFNDDDDSDIVSPPFEPHVESASNKKKRKKKHTSKSRSPKRSNLKRTRGTELNRQANDVDRLNAAFVPNLANEHVRNGVAETSKDELMRVSSHAIRKTVPKVAYNNGDAPLLPDNVGAQVQPETDQIIESTAAQVDNSMIIKDPPKLMVSVDLDKGINISYLRKAKPIEPAVPFELNGIELNYVEKKRRKINELAREKAKSKSFEDRAELEKMPLAARKDKKSIPSNTQRRRVPSKAEQKMFPISKHSGIDNKSVSTSQRIYDTKAITSELLKRSQYSRIIETGSSSDEYSPPTATQLRFSPRRGFRPQSPEI